MGFLSPNSIRIVFWKIRCCKASITRGQVGLALFALPQHTRIKTPSLFAELAFEVGADEFVFAGGFRGSEIGAFVGQCHSGIEEGADLWWGRRDLWAGDGRLGSVRVARPVLEMCFVPGP